MIIIEAREVKRLSKKIKENYFPLQAGESWGPHTGDGGEKVIIIAGQTNAKTLWVGRRK